jgi:hypothetical protein
MICNFVPVGHADLLTNVEINLNRPSNQFLFFKKENEEENSTRNFFKLKLNPQCFSPPN